MAIVPVIAFHFGFGPPGGFVGVDIFFVISGFLITGLLLGDLERGTFSFVRFYERRVRRIFPAMLLVLFVTTVAAMVVLLPTDLMRFGKSLLSTAGFASNLYFWRATAYFDRTADSKPLLHTWSLATEEQFYVLFPVVLWAVYRVSRQWLGRALVLGLVGSFAACVWAAGAAPVAGFYLLPTRGWELMIGALLAVGIVPPSNRGWIRHVTSMAGLLAILASVVVIKPSPSFPGWIALLPCVGAALVIYASQCGGGLANRALALRPFVALGLISYSLYLWHWPTLVLVQHWVGPVPPLGQTIVIVLVTVSAFLSFRYVESPIRHRHAIRETKHLFIAAGVATGLIAALGLLIVRRAGLPDRLPSAARLALDFSDDFSDPECFNLTARDVRTDKLCRIGLTTGSTPSFIVWGDSHADRLAFAVSSIARSHEQTGIVAAAGGCPPLIGVRAALASCQQFNQAVVDTIDSSRHRTIVLAAVWGAYSEGASLNQSDGYQLSMLLRDDESTESSAAETRRVLRRALRRTVGHFVDAGRRVVVIGPVPEMPFSVPEALAFSIWHHRPRPLGPTRREFDQRERFFFEVMADVVRSYPVTLIRPDSALCRERCEPDADGRPLYADSNHLSRAGLELVAPLMSDLFSPQDAGRTEQPQLGRRDRDSPLR